ncbi:hypothetical protein GCM10022291_12680 [Postechiella marina]|uniref:Menorin-like domain-containing protein n=1 Tax=Postechiella marina TaxID=943941 RepID=A0ABP8C5L2_9FLAO
MKTHKLFKVSLKLLFSFLLVLVVYTFCPYKLDFLGHYNKVWAHRANSIEKLNSALNYYGGVELDLVYNTENNFFDVNHPPSKSHDLKFETYIQGLKKPERLKGIWLDIKNLNKENASAILYKIIKILDSKNIKYQSVLIETRYPEALPIFTKMGFKTSYYLPYKLYQKNDKELKNTVFKINQILKNQPNIAISSSYKDYTIMHQYFPDTPKYFWDLVWPINIDFLLTRRILKDKTVKIVLVHYFAFKGNRF